MDLFDVNKDYTIGQWADIWFENYAKCELKKSTQKIHINARKRVTNKFNCFEEKLISELRPLDFQQILNSFQDEYSKSSIKQIKHFYYSIYRLAEKNGICQKNPLKFVTVPRNAKVKKVSALNVFEQMKVENILNKLPQIDEFIIRLYLHTGLRRNELLDLKWEDVRQDKYIKVVESKTEQGKRTIPLTEEARLIIKYLKNQKRFHKENSEYVFAINGKRVTESHIRHICDKSAKLAEINHVTAHILRHTFATRLLEGGANIKTVSVLLGHTDVSFTMKRYITLDFSYIENEINILSKKKPLPTEAEASNNYIDIFVK